VSNDTTDVAGVTRWKGRLDWVIRQLRPQGSIDFVLLQILRLGVYELVELGLPDHVINDHVDLARKLVRPEAATVANGEHLRLERSCTSGEGLQLEEMLLASIGKRWSRSTNLE